MKTMLTIRQDLIPDLRVERTADSDRIYELLDYWESNPRGQVSLELRGQVHSVDYVLAPQAFLNYIGRGERFGGYVNDMVFISSDMVKTHPEWLPYVALKLYAERFVDQGLDTSGKVKHWQSLVRTMKLAGATMPQKEVEEFLSAIESGESTGRFDLLRKSYNEFIKLGGGDPSKAKRDYLEKHHNNLWVRRGRTAEALDSIGFENDGYRNHAEAILNGIFRLDVENQYLLASFVKGLKGVGTNVHISVTPPFTGFAYAMTRDCNGLVDLVRFIEEGDTSVSGDVIIKLPKKERTWDALSKRMSFRIHKAERAAKEIQELEAKKLEGIVIQIEEANREMDKNVISLRELVVKNPFGDISARLGKLGSEYQHLVEGFRKESESIVANLASLKQLSSVLEARI